MLGVGPSGHRGGTRCSASYPGDRGPVKRATLSPKQDETGTALAHLS